MTDQTTSHPVEKAYREAAAKLLTLRCQAKVSGNREFTRADGKDFNQDLDALARILDPLFLACGHYANESFGLRQSSVDELFTDRIRAIVDDASFAVTQCIDADYEQRADDAFHGRAA